jgi:glycosyltransferase involved in cell wall biosynthesis
MRVLLVTGIFPPDIGGPSTYVPILAEGLLDRGHSVTVVTMSDRPAVREAFPFPVTRLPRRRFAPTRWAAGVAAVIRAAARVDVILATGLYMQTTTANILQRKPLVLRVVSDIAWDRASAYGWIDETLEEFQRRRHGGRVGLLTKVQTWTFHRADLILVPSRWLARWLAGLGIAPERVRVVPNAVAVDPPARPSQGMGRPLRRAIAVGRLVPVKRFDQILGAMAELPEVTLRLIGDGPEAGRLRGLAATLGVSDRVVFAGRRRREETLEAIAASDTLIVASAHEGFSWVVLEAMALGVPVIAPAVGGIPEVVDDGRTGLLHDGSASGIVDALTRLGETPGLAQRLSENARTLVTEKFGVPAMVDATIGVLTDAIGRRR